MSTFRAYDDHAALVARLLYDFNTEFESPVPGLDVLTRRFERMLRRDDVLVLIAGSPDVPVGFALVTLRPTPYGDGPLAALDELYVQPDLRGRGHGSELITQVLAELRQRGCGELQINVDSGDADTRRFYEAHGFTNVQPGTDEQMLCYLHEL